MLGKLNLAQVKAKIDNKDTFVLNIVAQWCPDCTERQAVHMDKFVDTCDKVNLDVIELLVQEERLVFLSRDHETFVESLGGHGYPRTVLFKGGVAADSDNVEIITESSLADLSEKFIRQL